VTKLAPIFLTKKKQTNSKSQNAKNASIDCSGIAADSAHFLALQRHCRILSGIAA